MTVSIWPTHCATLSYFIWDGIDCQVDSNFRKMRLMLALVWIEIESVLIALLTLLLPLGPALEAQVSARGHLPESHPASAVPAGWRLDVQLSLYSSRLHPSSHEP